MKKFKFALQPVLSLRERKEEQIKQQYAAKIGQLVETQKIRTGLIAQLHDLQDSEKKKRANANSITTLRYSISYRFKLKNDLLSISRKIDDMNAEAIQIQKKLILAAKDRRAIELIKERQIKEWKKEYRLNEQGIIDDISQQGYTRKSKPRTEQ
ncbi:MAG TPA: flagellar export protein FliJ [Chitinispirillaceae bacterium]|nr:flagellar export protein FliJ [Chitinispirillaceae bacterium]